MEKELKVRTKATYVTTVKPLEGMEFVMNESYGKVTSELMKKGKYTSIYFNNEEIEVESESPYFSSILSKTWYEMLKDCMVSAEEVCRT